MDFYIQYHNVDKEGLPLSEPPFSATRLGIHTSRPHVQNAEGTVFLIVGMGKPRRYFLWQAFEIEKVRVDSEGQFLATGPGWELAPPIELKGVRFEEFKSACANFVAFRCINDQPFARTLKKLAEEHRPPGDPKKLVSFLKSVDATLSADELEHTKIRTALGHYEPVRALSIRQPHAEAILRGVKKVEFRSGPTKIRGRVFIYASQTRFSADSEAEMMSFYRIKDVSSDDLPRGVLLGTVDLHKCDGEKWHLRKPERAERLIEPTGKPQPVWFYPF